MNDDNIQFVLGPTMSMKELAKVQASLASKYTLWGIEDLLNMFCGRCGNEQLTSIIYQSQPFNPKDHGRIFYICPCCWYAQESILVYEQPEKQTAEIAASAAC